eukprot:gene9250-9330_t
MTDHTKSPVSTPDLRLRTIALVGLMGVGKTSIGKRLAAALDLPFRDADEAIETAAGRSIAEIFSERGEEEFRAGERRVIARLLEDPPHVLATGGGAFVQPQTRALIKSRTVSVWLRADLQVLARRVARKDTRPLVAGKDPLVVLQAQAEARYPAYAEADIVVDTGEMSHAASLELVLEGLRRHRRIVKVALDGRAYEVWIGDGLMSQAGAALLDVIPRRRTMVVTDETVARLHGETVRAGFEQSGISTEFIVLPPGEQTKSFEGLADLSDRLLAAQLDRGDVITALGGGVIGDLTGFAAAIYKRGIDFVQIPTTLLAQVDSSVGGKTAIDTPRGKNLIGAFHQPRRVLADLDALATLPLREFKAGYAEVLKYGLLGDFAFFENLETRSNRLLAMDRDVLALAVERSVAMKAEIVAEDEREAGRRALLNLGHTFGHALEAETGFGDALLHGEAVAVGMALAFRFAASEGNCPDVDAKRAVSAIDAAGLPTRLSQVRPQPFPVARLIEHMRQDKKAEHGTITLVLPRRIGETYIEKGVSNARLESFLLSERAV